jgi:hypothetical protein
VLSVLLSPRSQQPLTPEVFGQAVAEAKILPESATAATLRFCSIVLQYRTSLLQIVDRVRTGIQVLPAFTGVFTTVDIRPRFSKGRITLVVPVALVLIKTDERERSHFWFQATKPQLQELIKELGEALNRIDIAEQWAVQKSSSVSERTGE